MNTSQRKQLTGALFILLLTFLAYLPALFAKFIWDDEWHFEQNPHMNDLAGLKALWTRQVLYYPLTSTSFWIERRLWGLQPLPYHALNILLQAINSILLWRLLTRLKVPGAWLAAAIFAIHPVHVQTTAWVTELKNTQSGFFYLLSLISFARFGEGKNWKWYIASLALFPIAFLSKTSTVMLPFILILIHGWMRRSLKPKDLTPLIPFFILALCAGLFTAANDNSRVAGSGDWNETLGQRFLIASRVVWFYFFKFFWPSNLTFVYPRWHTATSDLKDFSPLLGLLLIAILIFRLPDNQKRYVLYPLAYFLLSLFPVMQFFTIYYTRYSYVADHWQYLADMGLAAWTGAAASKCWQGLSPRLQFLPPAHSLKVAGISGLLLLLSLFTFRQATAYSNIQSIWNDTLSKNPDAWLAHTNLGVSLMNEGKIELAVPHFERSIRLKSNHFEARVGLASALLKLGYPEQAKQEFLLALTIQPNSADALNGLGGVYTAVGNPEAALTSFQRAVEAQPGNVTAWMNKASVLEKQQRAEEAISAYRAVLALAPDYSMAHANLATLLDQQQKTDEALREFQKAIASDPSNAKAHLNMGTVLAKKGRTPDAIKHFGRAVALEPDNAYAHYNLGRALKQIGADLEGEQQIQQAYKLNPALKQHAEPTRPKP